MLPHWRFSGRLLAFRIFLEILKIFKTFPFSSEKKTKLSVIWKKIDGNREEWARDIYPSKRKNIEIAAFFNFFLFSS